jgi:hypothetical protein
MTDLKEFQSWPKITRFSDLYCVITEKIDGTNAQLCVLEDGTILTGSRTRWVVPGNDNFGFAAWAKRHQDELRKLPVGRYYGEYYGVGIQRGYGLDDRRLSLFWTPACELPACVSVVPTLYAGPFTKEIVEQTHAQLVTEGSRAVPGFMKPEGVVVNVPAAKARFKITDLAQGKKAA